MNLSDIITKCYILALIIRDDGERLLLGDGFYEFKENLQHFQPNTFVNDVVELQGTDGQLLAGQVRRTAVQTFEGFIADGTIGREQTETNRRRFLQFFRKKHFYTVVYILPDGSAVQRDRGYIVNAPSVPELYQRFPEYSVGLNFEDPNYYEYDEGEDGEEIPAHSVVLSIANLLEGGLIWDAFGAVSNEKTWLDWENGTTTAGFYTYNNGLAGAPLEFTQLDGNATQQTYTGKNLAEVVCRESAAQGIMATYNSETGVITLSGTATTVHSTPFQPINVNIPAGTYTLKQYGTLSHGCIGVNLRRADNTQITEQLVNTSTLQNTFTLTEDAKIMQLLTGGHQANDSVSGNIQVLLVAGSTAGDFEKFVGGIPAPNPDYPQPVNVVTGLQTVHITGENLFDIATLNKGGITVTDGVASGAASDFHANFGINAGGIDFVKPNGEISVSATAYTDANASTDGNGLTMAFSYTDGTTSYIGIWRNNDTSARRLTGHPTTGKTVTGIFISYASKGANTWHISEFMVNVGSTAENYVPFHGSKYYLGGTNFFNKSTPPAQGATIITETTDGIKATCTSASTYIWGAIIVGKRSTFAGKNITLRAEWVESASNTGAIGLGYCNEDASSRSLQGTTIATSGDSKTYFVTDNDATKPYLYVVFYANTSGTAQIGDYVDYTHIMLNEGTTPWPYAPYKTPFELAGVGPIQSDGLPLYHDSFKRVDGVWYKHAEVGKVVLNGSEAGWASFELYSDRSKAYTPVGNVGIPENAEAISDKYTYNGTTSSAQNKFGQFSINNSLNLTFSPSITTLNDAKLWLNDNTPVIYYVLATPTDTAITDTDLLAQLNAIASTYDGVNNITITPSAGAQGELSVHYATGSIDVGAGYEWEEGSDTGTNIIVNNGIDSVFPTWIVPGPATNPTLTNITTGQTIVWEGSVASGQTLTVDLNRQTAELGGTNVFAQLSGDWVKLAPGPNKLAYSATGATEGCRLEWNGVVG